MGSLRDEGSRSDVYSLIFCSKLTNFTSKVGFDLLEMYFGRIVSIFVKLGSVCVILSSGLLGVMEIRSSIESSFEANGDSSSEILEENGEFEFKILLAIAEARGVFMFGILFLHIIYMVCKSIFLRAGMYIYMCLI